MTDIVEAIKALVDPTATPRMPGVSWVVGAAGALVSLLVATLTAFAAPWVLRALPEPADAPDKIPYPDLIKPGLRRWVFAVSLAAGLVAMTSTHPATWVGWVALTGPLLLSAVVDFHTTYLPLPLTRLGWLFAALGGAVAAGVTFDPWPAARAAVGALAMGGFLWLAWRFTGGFGFGDVRLAAAIGAVTAGDSWELLLSALLFGTSLGAVWGLVHRARHGPGPFPYGPSLLAGPFLAVVVRGLVPGG